MTTHIIKYADLAGTGVVIQIGVTDRRELQNIVRHLRDILGDDICIDCEDPPEIIIYDVLRPEVFAAAKYIKNVLLMHGRAYLKDWVQIDIPDGQPKDVDAQVRLGDVLVKMIVMANECYYVDFEHFQEQYMHQEASATCHSS